MSDEPSCRRQAMVQQQLVARGVRDAAVLQAMGALPREHFLDAALAAFAYDDTPLPIGDGQTLSQPYVVAAMLEAAELRPVDRALEVGAGSGYLAALLGRIVRTVHALERRSALAAAAQQRLAALGLTNVELRAGDGSAGWPDGGRFDAILVSAGGPDVPAPLMAQLAPGGRLVMPVGGRTRQQLVKRVRRADGGFDEQTLASVRFVPLVGAHGWDVFG